MIRISCSSSSFGGPPTPAMEAKEGRLRRLILLRHAKSSWEDSSLTDHDRPLSKSGEADVIQISYKLHNLNWIPQLILSRLPYLSIPFLCYFLCMTTLCYVMLCYVMLCYVAMQDEHGRLLKSCTSISPNLLLLTFFLFLAFILFQLWTAKQLITFNKLYVNTLRMIYTRLCVSDIIEVGRRPRPLFLVPKLNSTIVMLHCFNRLLLPIHGNRHFFSRAGTSNN